MLRRIAASLAAMRRAIEVPTLLDVQNPTVAALTPAARALTATPSGRGPPVGQIALVATTAAAPSAAIQVAEAPRPAHARALTVRMAAMLQRASTIAPEPAVAMAPHAAAPRTIPTQKASAFKRFCPAQGSPRVAR